MKLRINRITIVADFQTEQELCNLLNKIADDYKNGNRSRKNTLIDWNVQEKYRDDEMDDGVTVGEMSGKNIRFENREGKRYILVGSKINYNK